MRLLRLRQLHNGVFIRLNKASINMLRRVEPYITYGYPTRENIRKLILKRGFGKVNRQRIPLQSNNTVEQVLGKHKINTVEDLINEISNCGEHFKEANNFLWPFKLRGPRGGFNAKRHPFQMRGDWGNREVYINNLIKQMLWFYLNQHKILILIQYDIVLNDLNFKCLNIALIISHQLGFFL